MGVTGGFPFAGAMGVTGGAGRSADGTTVLERLGWHEQSNGFGNRPDGLNDEGTGDAGQPADIHALPECYG
jgi:hypothetical protein